MSDSHVKAKGTSWTEIVNVFILLGPLFNLYRTGKFYEYLYALQAVGSIHLLRIDSHFLLTLPPSP